MPELTRLEKEVKRNVLRNMFGVCMNCDAKAGDMHTKNCTNVLNPDAAKAIPYYLRAYEGNI